MDDRRRRRPAHRLWRATGGGALVSLAWLVFAGTLDVQDLVMAIAVGAAAIVATTLLRRGLGHHPAPTRRWLGLVPTIAAGLVRDTAVVVRALPSLRRRGPLGKVVEVPFDVTGTSAEEAASRRVLAIMATTMQPNTILLGYDRDRGVALLHVLTDSGPAEHVDARLSRPGGGP